MASGKSSGDMPSAAWVSVASDSATTLRCTAAGSETSSAIGSPADAPGYPYRSSMVSAGVMPAIDEAENDKE
jgi:hypothetical protein